MATIKVHVTPRSSKNEIVGRRGDLLRVKTTAPPVDGAANEAIVRLVADTLGVRKSRVRIVAGEKSREKIVCVDELSDEQAQARLRERWGI